MPYLLNSSDSLKPLNCLLPSFAVQAPEGSSKAGKGNHVGTLVEEGVLSGREGVEGLCVSPNGVDIVKVQGPEEVVQDAVRGDGGQVPAENVEDNHFPLLKDKEKESGSVMK
jgi:hypothetical protein